MLYKDSQIKNSNSLQNQWLFMQTDFLKTKNRNVSLTYDC